MKHELKRVSSGTVGIYLANLRTAFQKAVDSDLLSCLSTESAR